MKCKLLIIEAKQRSSVGLGTGWLQMEKEIILILKGLCVWSVQYEVKTFFFAFDIKLQNAIFQP